MDLKYKFRTEDWVHLNKVKPKVFVIFQITFRDIYFMTTQEKEAD